MAIKSNIKVTLNAGQQTLLHRSRFEACRVTLTGLSGEFTTIPFRTKTSGFFDSGLFEASEVKLKRFQAVPKGEVFATTPGGVATLDIVFEVGTRADA